MTRNQAIKIVGSVQSGGEAGEYFVTALAALGLLKFDAIDDETFRKAGAVLWNKRVTIIGEYGSTEIGQLAQGGAYEVLDILRKSGFKITGPET